MKEVIQEIENINNSFNYLVETIPIDENYDGDFITISIKDAILIKNSQARSSSKILNNYFPVNDSKVIKNTKDYFKNKNIKPIFIGKTIHDEFGFGGYNVNVGIDKKIPKNPYDDKRSCGGSSGGCAGFTAKTKFRHISIAESTGGSISTPASFCGVYGLTPTYGLISRDGLISYANSLDKIGIMAKDILDIAVGLEMIDGYDLNDCTNVKHENKNYVDLLNDDTKYKNNTIKIGLINLDENNQINNNVKDKIDQLKNNLDKSNIKVEIETVDISFINKYSLPVYYILSLSEASTNLSKLCGLRYGVQNIPTNWDLNVYLHSRIEYILAL